MVISENFVWFTNENNRRLNVKVISSYINEREENFPYQKLLQKQNKKQHKNEHFGNFYSFSPDFRRSSFLSKRSYDQNISISASNQKKPLC